MIFKTQPWKQAFLSSDKFLRLAGQSLRDEHDRFFDERLVAPFVVVIAFWMVCIVAWIQKIAGHNPDPRFWTLLSLFVTVYGGFEVFRLRPHLRRLRERRRGDHRVIRLLERLRRKGFVALHDLAANRFKIDHVIVGPAGVFAIEAKSWNTFGSRTIDCQNDSELLLAGRIRDGRALQQAREAAAALQLTLKDQLRDHRPVKGLLVFAGDWTVQCQADHLDIDVLAAEEIEDYFDEQQPQLTGREVADICSHLERSARR